MRKVVPIYDPKHVRDFDDLVRLRPTGSANFPAYLEHFGEMLCRLQNRRQKTMTPELWDASTVGAMNFKLQPNVRWSFYLYATLDYPLYQPSGQIKLIGVELVNTELRSDFIDFVDKRYGGDTEIPGEFTVIEFLELMDKVHRGMYAI